MPRSIPPPGDQPVALIFRNLELLDRLRYRALLVRSVNDADELGWGAADVVDGPRVVALRLDRSLRHAGGGIIGRTSAGAYMGPSAARAPDPETAAHAVGEAARGTEAGLGA
jgi:hypothetical protein